MSVQVKYPLVFVEWIDASSSHGWKTPEESTRGSIARVFQPGFLLYEDKEKIILGGAWSPCHDDDDEVEIADKHIIPQKMIKRIIKIPIGSFFKKA